MNSDVTEASDFANRSLGVHQRAVDKALDRKRKLGQYWVVWDGEKPVEVHPDTKQTAAE
ncbi:hypothetical protein [Asticcacaulis sp. AC402]|uniref:hypothetical protein n=1 Tax=Asticcacaulis sp. AC402 TaxID=1282361 RepID=UPI0003C3B51D|nr:hypothetical protein [Asticcacaulis sp. AC402]ESQ74198.1 hypothetical protein ABAC402_15440 [Asticcacaulis sp. AC402]